MDSTRVMPSVSGGNAARECDRSDFSPTPPFLSVTRPAAVAVGGQRSAVMLEP